MEMPNVTSSLVGEGAHRRCRDAEPSIQVDQTNMQIPDSIFKQPIQLRTVIPGRAQREPGIHNHDREYGFRASAKWRIHDVHLHIGE